MVSQQGRHGAGVAEPGHFARADAALGTHDQQHLAAPRDRRPWAQREKFRPASLQHLAQRTHGVLVQDDREVRGGHRRLQPGAVDGGADLRDPRPPGLLGRRRDHRLPLGVGLRRTLGLPTDNRPFRLPGHNRVDSQFGGGFGRELVPVALREGLDQDQPHRGLGLLEEPRSSAPSARSGRRRRRRRSGACRRRRRCPRLPHGKTLHRDRMAGFRSVENEDGTGNQPVQGAGGSEKDRVAHRYRLPSRSRSFAKTPPLAASFPSVNCSPRSFASWRSRSSWAASSLAGVSTWRWTLRSPRP